MFLRQLRQTRELSQERLAEISGLSLRTIQRVEAGHRVGYASLRVLAATFNIDVDVLERELYAMKASTEEFVEIPLWVRRLVIDRGWWRGMSRRDTQKLEVIMVMFASLCFGVSFFVPEKEFPWGATIGDVVRFGGLMALISAYSCSITMRVCNQYNLWPAIEASHPGGFFGFRRSKSADAAKPQ
jgi:transcriptional regulator with XRE-family HTH domain